MTNNLEDEIFADSQSDSQTDFTNVDKLSELILDLKAKDMEIEAREQELSQLKKEQREISMGKIPDLFDEMQMSKITMEDGSVVEIKRDFAASISAAKKDSCFEWLKKSGNDGIIKRDIVVKFKKGENEEVDTLRNKLGELGMTYTDKEYVHPMTLKAFVKEQMEKGTDIPQEDFAIFPVRKTKIK